MLDILGDSVPDPSVIFSTYRPDACARLTDIPPSAGPHDTKSPESFAFVVRPETYDVAETVAQLPASFARSLGVHSMKRPRSLDDRRCIPRSAWGSFHGSGCMGRAPIAG